METNAKLIKMSIEVHLGLSGRESAGAIQLIDMDSLIEI